MSDTTTITQDVDGSEPAFWFMDDNGKRYELPVSTIERVRINRDGYLVVTTASETFTFEHPDAVERFSGVLYAFFNIEKE